MSQDLAEYGIYFNELDKLCILEPEVYKQTNNLNEECKSYFQSKYLMCNNNDLLVNSWPCLCLFYCKIMAQSLALHIPQEKS